MKTPLLPLLLAAALSGAPLPAAEPIGLFNGRDLAGWTVFLADKSVDPATVWSVDGGALRLDAKKVNGYIRTKESFSNYSLRVEWRWLPDAPANANSGVLLHLAGEDAVWPAAFECQLRTGNAGQVIGMGLDIPDAPVQNNRKRSPRLADPSEKPHGEWNTYEIHCRGDTIEVFVNGVRQNFVSKLPVTAGAIALQMEGAPVEFRNVRLTPL